MAVSTRELLRRRVPQVVGVYLAGGWGLLEFTSWATSRFGLTERWEDLLMVVLLGLLPVVTLAAWRAGGGSGSDGGATVSVEGPDDETPEPPAGEEPFSPDPKSVAVLPFAVPDGDPDAAWLGDGIAEEIINGLGMVEGLKVCARTSAFAWRGRTDDVRRIGRALGVASVLEGSLQRSGDRLRVSTRLVDTSDGYQLWAGRFDRAMSDVFAIQDEIAGNVARTLRVLLREGEREAMSRIPVGDVRAYEAWLRGRQFLHRSSKQSLEFAREMFRRAIAIEPGYALAWAGLAEAAGRQSMFYRDDPEALAEAEEASARALESDPRLADAHASRGLALFLLDRFDEAEEAFRAAIRLDPRTYGARYYYARACFQAGRIEDAERLFAEALEAREEHEAAFFLAQAREALGRHEEARGAYRAALRVVESHMELNPDDARAATMRAVALCRTGRLEEGLEWGRRAMALDPGDGGVRYNVACLFALEGLREEALDCLEDALRAGFGNLDWIQNDPDLASLRDDPRYAALMKDAPGA